MWGGPAQQAMIADLLEGEKRAEGYGIQRVAVNLAVAIGPAIGGLLATKSYMFLFVIDAVTSIITAGIVYFALPETRPVKEDGEPATDFLDTIKGYGTVARDRLFMAFWAVSLLVVIVYQQLNSTLSVYLRDVHGFTAQEFGYLLSLNAAMVVLFQFWITRRISRRPAMLMMATGTALYAVGFALFGLVTTFALFILAIVIITIGEMIVTPVAQALVAEFAPEDMRGRYMAVFGFTWAIPFAFGPLLAGLIIDNYNPDLVWYLSGVIGLLAVGGYLLIYSKRDRLGERASSTAVESRTD